MGDVFVAKKTFTSPSPDNGSCSKQTTSVSYPKNCQNKAASPKAVLPRSPHTFARRSSIVSLSRRGNRRSSVEMPDMLLSEEEQLQWQSIMEISPLHRTNMQAEHILSLMNLDIIPFFRPLSHEALIDICKQVTSKTLNENEVLFRQGSVGEHFYVVLEGCVGVYYTEETDGPHDDCTIHDVLQATLCAGRGFGEVALLGNTPRNATIKAHKRTQLLVIGRHEYKRCLQREHVKYMLRHIDFVRNNFLFKDWPDYGLVRLSHVLVQKKYSRNTVIYRQGDVPSFACIIKSGEARVVVACNDEQILGDQRGRKKQTRQVEVAILGPGEFLGEAEVVSGLRRKETVVALTDIDSYQLSRRHFIRNIRGESLRKLKRMIAEIDSYRQEQIALAVVQLSQIGGGNACIRPRTRDNMTKHIVRPHTAMAVTRGKKNTIINIADHSSEKGTTAEQSEMAPKYKRTGPPTIINNLFRKPTFHSLENALHFNTTHISGIFDPTTKSAQDCAQSNKHHFLLTKPRSYHTPVVQNRGTSGMTCSTMNLHSHSFTRPSTSPSLGAYQTSFSRQSHKNHSSPFYNTRPVSTGGFRHWGSKYISSPTVKTFQFHIPAKQMCTSFSCGSLLPSDQDPSSTSSIVTPTKSKNSLQY